VIDTAPEPNALDVSPTARVRATFNGDVDASTVSTSTFPVWGAQTGRYGGTYSVPDRDRVRFEAATAFKPGEVIVAAASSGVERSGGGSLTPYIWQFTAAVPCGTGTFLAAQDYAVGKLPQSVAVGDLDGDGDLDLAVANYSDNTVSVLRNNGNGTFAAQVTYAVGEEPLRVAVGDLDGDGDLDLLNANAGGGTVSVLRNRGDAKFAAQVTYNVGDTPTSAAAGDLDGDGDLDLAVANWGAGTVSVLRNRGDGTFVAQVTYNAGDGPRSVAVGDLDGDGDLDLAVNNAAANTLSVLLNEGDGTFAVQVTYAAGDTPLSVAAGDLDGEGDLDLVNANFSDDNVSVLLNRGDGTFAAQVTYAVGDEPASVAAGDLDGDGDPDLAVANAGDGTVSVLRNLGDGTFAAAVNYDLGYHPSSVAAGDLDGDGDLDLAVANAGNDTVSVLMGVTPPTAPILSFPPDGGSTCDSTLTFQWSPVSGSYRLQVDDDRDFSSKLVDATTSEPSHTPGSALPLGIYYWRVKALSPCGDSPWSDKGQFSIVSTLPAPSLSWPPKGGRTCGTTPTFQWSPVSGSYRIQVDDDRDFSSKLIDTTSSEASYAPDSALPLDTYYWRVKALSGCGDSAWSPKGRFAHMGCGYLPLIVRDY
jgi:hypothetical protein